LLCLDPIDVLDEPAPVGVSCGVPFLFVAVRDRGCLGRARLNPATWQALLEPWWTSHVYLYTHDAELAGSTLRGRCFVPAAGIGEDPATGGAVTALAGHLLSLEPASVKSRRWVIEQGFEMGRPSLLNAEAERHEGCVTAIRVGGAVTFFAEGRLHI
jgi:trans-2,3-dihydro-3-hydroxyanthranilate isomerase